MLAPRGVPNARGYGVDTQTHLIDLPESELSRLLETFCTFLGKRRLEGKVKTIELAMLHSGPIYQRHWLRPHALLWLGLVDALRLDSQKRLRLVEITAEVAYAIHQVATVCQALESMPPWKRTDIRNRLLDKTDPILYRLAQPGGTIRKSLLLA